MIVRSGFCLIYLWDSSSWHLKNEMLFKPRFSCSKLSHYTSLLYQSLCQWTEVTRLSEAEHVVTRCPCSNHKLALSHCVRTSLLLTTWTFKIHNLSGLGSFECDGTQNTQGKEEQSWLVHATSTALKCKRIVDNRALLPPSPFTGTAQFNSEASHHLVGNVTKSHSSLHMSLGSPVHPTPKE